MLWRFASNLALLLVLELVLVVLSSSSSSSATLIDSNNASSDEESLLLDPNAHPTIVNGDEFSILASSSSSSSSSSRSLNRNIKSMSMSKSMSKSLSVYDNRYYDFTADVFCCGTTTASTAMIIIIDDKDDDTDNDNDNNNNDNHPDDLLSMNTALFQSSDKFSDITFVVGTGTGTGSGSNDNNSIVRKEFKAHKIILQLRAKTLLELVLENADEDNIDNKDDSSSKSKSLVVTIPDVDVHSFEIILRYVYTQELLDVEHPDYPTTEEETILLLQVADRFGLTEVKIYLESILVETYLSTATAAKMLAVAEIYSCTYLKEAAMEKYALHPTTVTQSASWSTYLISESPKLLLELLQYTNVDRVHSNNNNNNNNNENEDEEDARNRNIEHLSISSLRDRLKENKLELQGSRQILVDRLKNHSEIVAGIVGNSDKK